MGTNSKVTFYYIASIMLTDRLSENSEIRYLDNSTILTWPNFTRNKDKAITFTTYAHAWEVFLATYATNKTYLTDMSFFIYAECREATKDRDFNIDSDPVAAFIKARKQ